MQTYNDEIVILQDFQGVKIEEIFMIGNKFKCLKILHHIKNINSKNWKNSSAKNDPPPDFFNDKSKLLLEVMTVEDNSHKNKKGKLINKTKEKESQILKKYFGNNYKNERNDLKIFVVADSGLSTNEDHNFSRYFNNFNRVFSKHNNQIDLYKKERLDYKTIFFIFDESTAYAEPEDEKEKMNLYEGKEFKAKPHLSFLDFKFLEIIKNSNVDYVVWYAPWKLIRKKNNKMFKLPKAVIIDVKRMDDLNNKMIIKYDHSKMVSMEV